MLSVTDDARLDDATGSTPEATLEAYAQRDPRAGQTIGEHKVGLTFLAAATSGKCSRVAFTLPGIAEVIGRPNLVVAGMSLTGVMLSEGRTFTGIVASHRGGVIRVQQAAEILQARGVRGIVYVHPREDGWRILVPLSQRRGVKEREPYGAEEPKRRPRYINVFEILAARVNGLFDGRLDPTVFEPGLAISIGGVHDLKVVDGQFIDRNDRTYRTSIFRDGSTIVSRAAASKASSPKKLKRPTRAPPAAGVVKLPQLGSIAITELSPNYQVHAGKRIGRKGRISEYPRVAFWHQRVVEIPARVNALANYLQDARATRNVIIIRGKPANVERAETRRQIANIKDEEGRDRGDHGFEEQLSRALFLDIDRAQVNWRGNADGAIRWILARLGEPFSSASCAWIFTGTHGLETEVVGTGRFDDKGVEITVKRWTGNIVDGVVRARLAFVTDRPISGAEAKALTQQAATACEAITVDPCIVNLVQPNYIRRMLWEEHPNRDPLGDIPTAGVVEGAHEHLICPHGLEIKARWQAAQGHGGQVASHPSAAAAVGAIGTDGHIRHHLTSAIGHLATRNPLPQGATILSHAATLAQELYDMVQECEAEVRGNLAACKRGFEEVLAHFPKGMTDYATWKLPRAASRGRKTVKLAYEPRDDTAQESMQETIERVERTIQGARDGVTLLIAGTGTRKSTSIRARMVEDAAADATRTTVLLVPRHDLGGEQLERLASEFPDGDFTAAVWKGRDRIDTEFIGPQQPGKERLMCWRPEEAKLLENALMPVSRHLCCYRRYPGDEPILCPLIDYCGSWRQRQVKANIRIGAHELLGHQPPPSFGEIGRVYVDESPIKALTFGVSDGDEVEIPLDSLTKPPRGMTGLAGFELMEARKALHAALSALELPADGHLGAPVTREVLHEFFGEANPLPANPVTSESRKRESEPVDPDDNLAMLNAIIANRKYTATYDPAKMAALEWQAKVVPPVRPHMSKHRIEQMLTLTADNAGIRNRALLWEQLGHSGRVQVHQGEKGRVIRVKGMRTIAKGWDVPTLIADATGDPDLLRLIRPELTCEFDGWGKAYRPEGVRVFQTVDASFSMDAVGVYGEEGSRERARREAAARRMWAALLVRAMEYGGQPIGAILYKSTKEWILENCHVPGSITLLHHGSVTGLNVLEKVRALFVVGRLLPSGEDVTRAAEALTGEYLPDRELVAMAKSGRILISPDGDGNNVVQVDAWRHPHPIAEKLRRQVTEAGANQNDGRARPNLRDASRPLDVHRWHDTPLPELGEVVPVLRDEVSAGLNELMLTGKDSAVWLENIAHAAKAHPGLFNANGLKVARDRAKSRKAEESVHSLYKAPYRECTDSSLFRFAYQLIGAGQKPASGVSLLGKAATRAFLLTRLGALAWFEPERREEAEAAE